jgi:predicted transcriptional regulator
MKAEKRSKLRIHYEILLTLSESGQSNTPLNATRVARRVNIAYDRFQKYLAELVEFDMVVVNHGKFTLTENGKQYIERFRTFEDFVWRLGLLKRQRYPLQ